MLAVSIKSFSSASCPSLFQRSFWLFDILKSIFSEYEILDFLHHPNIIKAYCFYFDDSTHNSAIHLEYCKFNLKQIINQLEDFELVGVIYEICLAMKHIHSKNVIHRDLKMPNILIDLDTSLTHGIGTIAFMAPEIFDENIIQWKSRHLFIWCHLVFHSNKRRDA